MRSVIKFLNTQSIPPFEIHRQLCQVYGHTRLDSQHISCRSSVGRFVIFHPIARTSRPVIFIFSYTSRNSCFQNDRSSAGRCLIIHPISRISRPVISIFSYTSRNSCPDRVNVFRMTEADMSLTQWFQRHRFTNKLRKDLCPVSRKLRYLSGSYRFVTAVDPITLRAVARRDSR